MLVFVTLILYALAILAIGLLRLFRRTFSYSWLAAALGALLAWGSVLAWRMDLPVKVLDAGWMPVEVFQVSPVFFVDELAWAYGLALASLALAVILTAPAQATGVSSSAWVGTLGLAAVGMLAFWAANPLTLALVWVALDLLELMNSLRLSKRPDLSERAVVSFTIRGLGTGLLMWASAINGLPLVSFESIEPQSGILLLLAVGLRLGVLPLHLAYRSEPALRRGMGTVLRLSVAASSLVLLARLPVGFVSSALSPFLQALLALALLYGGWNWLRAEDELSGRPYWMIGLGALSVWAALRGSPEGSAAWGLALILFGGLAFLYSSRQRLASILLSVLGFFLLSLPFTLTATAWQGVAPFDWLFWIFAVAGQVLMVGGYVRHLWHKSESDMASLPRWAQSAYPLGLMVLALPVVGLGVWGWPGALQLGFWPVALVVTLLTAIALLAWWRIARINALVGPRQEPLPVARPSDSRLAHVLEFFASMLWGFYRFLRRLLDFVSGLLEGDGGLLWTVLVLILLLLFFRTIA